MTREKFESLYSGNGEYPEAVEKDGEGNYKRMQTLSAWMIWNVAWLAGRESMRDEAVAVLEDSGPYATRLAMAAKVGKIEP